jgi:hypothetical protein
VDLHRTLIGASDSPLTWTALSEHAEPLQLATGQVTGLDEAGLAVIVTLHAAQHGVALRHPLDDLERAVTQLPIGVWRAAHELARAIDAHEAFGGGLALVPGGRELARALAVETVVTGRVALAAGDVASRNALVVHDFWAAGGWRARLALARIAVRPEGLGRRLRGVVPAVAAWWRVERASRRARHDA